MAITLPTPVRVAVGLVATGIDRLRSLPEDLPTIPVTLAGQAMRLSMRVQQEVAELATRGDQLLATVMGGPEENPEWARFDDEEPAPVTRLPSRDGAAASRPATPDDRERAATDRAAATLLERADAETPGGGAATEPGVGDAAVSPAGTASADRPAGARAAAPAGTGRRRAPRPAATSRVGTPTRRRQAGGRTDADGRTGAGEGTKAAPGPRRPPTEAGPPDPAASRVAPVEPIDRTPPAAPPADPVRRDPGSEPPTASFDLTADKAPTDRAAPAPPPAAVGGSDAGVLPEYDSMTLAQVRGHLRDLTAQEVGRLLTREQAGANRAPFLTLLSNRLVTLDHQSP